MADARYDGKGRGRYRRLLGSSFLLACVAMFGAGQARAQLDLDAAGAAAATPGQAQSDAGPAANPDAFAPAGEGFFDIGRPAGFSITKHGEASETYSTNGSGLSAGGIGGFGGGIGGGIRRGADWITRLSVSLGLHDTTPRFQGDIDYNLSGYLFGRNTTLNRIQNRLNAMARAVVVPDRLSFQARAFAAPVLLNQLGPLSSSGLPTANSSNSGIRDTYGYTVAPDLMFRLGDYAQSDTTVFHNSIFFAEPGGSSVGSVPGQSTPLNAVSLGVSERISNGTFFTRLNWNLLGSYNKIYRNAANLDEKSGIADFRYALSRVFSFLGTFGYQSIVSQTAVTHDLSGWTILGGGQITLGPRFSMSARAGQQFNFASYSGNIQYQVTPATAIIGALTDSVVTPGQRLLGNLSFMNVNAGGSFYNSQTSLPGGTGTGSGLGAFNAAPLDQLAIDSNISHYRSATLSLIHSEERTQYRLTFFHTTRDMLTALTLGTRQDQTSTGVDASVSRSLRPDLTASIDGSYSAYKVPGGDTNVMLGRVQLDYTLSMQTQIYAMGAYIRRNTSSFLSAVSPLSSDLSEASITIGVRRQF